MKGTIFFIIVNYATSLLHLDTFYPFAYSCKRHGAKCTEEYQGLEKIISYRLKIKLELQLLFPAAVTHLRPNYCQLMGNLKNQLGVVQANEQVMHLACEFEYCFCMSYRLFSEF